MKFSTRTTLVLPAAVLLFAPAGTAVAADWKDLVAKGRAEGTVVLATNIGNRTLREGLAQFQKKFGIQVDLRTQRSYETDAVMIRECAVNHPTIDLSLGGMGPAIYKKGCFAPIKPHLVLPEAVDGKNWLGGKIKYNDPNGDTLLETLTSVYGWIIVNSNKVNPATLKTSKDLLNPKYRGHIAAHDPRRGGAGQNAAAYFMYKLGDKYIRDLFKGQKVAYTRSYSGIGEWIARGTYWIGVGATARGIEKFRKAGLPLVVVQLKDTAYVAGSVGMLRYSKNAPHPAASAVFMNWFLSKEGQQMWSNTTREPSRRVDISKKNVPAYLIPKKGVKYFDTYNYKYNSKTHPEIARKLVKMLGR